MGTALLGDPTHGEKREAQAKAPQLGKERESFVPSSTKCPVVQLGGSVWLAPSGRERKLRRREEGEEAARSGGGGRAPQATGALGPGHISVRMSMRLLRPER